MIKKLIAGVVAVCIISACSIVLADAPKRTREGNISGDEMLAKVRMD